MALDIALLQRLYGANGQYHGGNDTYYLNDASSIGAMFGTIWDNRGAQDAIIYNGTLNAHIDLRAATLANAEGGGGYISYVDKPSGVTSGFTIANGVTIENATGGGGNDTIIGNSAANKLTGGPGNYSIDGITGIDTAVFSGLRSAYTITHIGNSIRVSGPDGSDTLTHVERLAFDDTTVPAGPAPKPHFNADANSDLLLLNNTNHGVAVWQMNGTQVVAKPQVGTINAAAGWHLPRQGDFNGDGKTDLLFLNDTTHGVAVWQMNGTQVASWPSGRHHQPAGGWDYQDTGDFNGDGKSDLLFLNDTTPRRRGLADERHAGRARPQVGTINAAGGWPSQDTGDFNGDGKTDLLFLNDTTHGVAVWQMNGRRSQPSALIGTINAAGGWHYDELGDFNGDGKTDMLLLNDTTHGVAVWQMNGTQVETSPQVGTINAAAGWHFQDVGDFNGDGKSDLLLFNDTNHGVAVWQMNGTQVELNPQVGTINAAGGWHYMACAISTATARPICCWKTALPTASRCGR